MNYIKLQILEKIELNGSSIVPFGKDIDVSKYPDIQPMLGMRSFNGSMERKYAKSPTRSFVRPETSHIYTRIEAGFEYKFNVKNFYDAHKNSNNINKKFIFP